MRYLLFGLLALSLVAAFWGSLPGCAGELWRVP